MILQVGKKTALILLYFIIIGNGLYAQSRTISGRVVSQSESEGIPGVSIIETGTINGTITDASGNYSLSVTEGSTLEFSFIGMRTHKQKLNDLAVIDVVMEEDIIGLDELVVVGYGTQKKSDLTGSVSSISNEEIESMPLTRLEEAFQGRVAGVEVMTTDAAPGGNIRVRIRGGNSIQGGNDPLYVVDGFVGYDIEALNPNEIESMEILKDASATAIYGSRGANGVVLITTKSGKKGFSQVDFNASVGVQIINQKLDMMNAAEFNHMMHEAEINFNNDQPLLLQKDTIYPVFTDEEIAAMGEGTDWQDEIFRAAIRQDYQLSFSGGDDKTNFALSTGYLNHEGIVIASNFTRYSTRLNLDRKMNKWLKVGARTNLIRSISKSVPVNGLWDPGITNAALRYPPTEAAYDSLGNYTNYLDAPYMIPQDNPLATALEPTRNVTDDRILASSYMDIQLIPGLKYTLDAGFTAKFYKNGYYNPTTTLSGSNNGGAATINSSKRLDWQITNILTYEKSLGIHSIKITGVYEQQVSSYDGFSASATQFLTDGFLYHNIGNGENPSPPQSWYSKSVLKSGMARINYILADKYLITGTLRADGSSKFGNGNKWGYFPSAAFSWRLTEEEFIQDNLPMFSRLKFRTSYGITGSQAAPPYQSLPLMKTDHETNAIINDNLAIGVGPGVPAYENLKWEKTAQYNVGLDAGFFSNRIVITTDYYMKKTTDLLLNVRIPTYSGFSTSLQNLGEVNNRGFEMAVSTVNTTGQLGWTTGVNFFLNRNVIVDLGDESQIITGGGSTSLSSSSDLGIMLLGRNIGLFYGYVTDGLWQRGEDNSLMPESHPGDQKYKDMNADGIMNADDRTIIGNNQPDFSFGLNNTLSYRGFNLSIMLYGVVGLDVMNLNRMQIENCKGAANCLAEAVDRWTSENTDALIPRAVTNISGIVSDRYVEEASYLKIKSITLSYNLSDAAIKKLGLQNASLFLNGLNLFTFTGYKGYDPEVNSRGNSNTELGIDWGSYPSAKTISLGVKIGF